VGLRVGDLEGDVVEPLRLADGAGSVDHLWRAVHPQRTSGCSHPRRIPRRLAGSTADIEDAVVTANAVGATEDPVVQLQLSIVIDKPIRGFTHEVFDTTGWSATIPSASWWQAEPTSKRRRASRRP
jgi:hypothetical protein